MISKTCENFFLGEGRGIEIEAYIIQLNQSKNQKIVVQNLSWRIFFQEQVKFLKSAFGFNSTIHQTHPVCCHIGRGSSDFWNSCKFCQLSSHIKELPLFCAPFAIVNKISLS